VIFMPELVDETIYSIILAAGNSKRLGQHKALLNIGNDTLINFIVKRLKKHNLTTIIVTREELMSDIRNFTQEVDIVPNHSPELGRTGSLQVGLNFIIENYSKNFKALVVPIDRPGFSSSTLSKLLTLDRTSCPEKDGKGGHPLLISELDIKRILDENPKIPLREIIRPEKFEVIDDFLHLNVDTEGDIPILMEFISSYYKENSFQ